MIYRPFSGEATRCPLRLYIALSFAVLSFIVPMPVVSPSKITFMPLAAFVVSTFRYALPAASFVPPSASGLALKKPTVSPSFEST